MHFAFLLLKTALQFLTNSYFYDRIYKNEVIYLKISTKGRYALRFLVDLAEHHEDGYIALKDVANRQNISKKYLEQIIAILNQTDFLLSNRGSQGGYKLARAPKDYTVFEILKRTEGSLAPVSCLEAETNCCDRKDECTTLYVWEGLQKVVTDYLSGITLQDIIDKKNENNAYDFSI